MLRMINFEDYSSEDERYQSWNTTRHYGRSLASISVSSGRPSSVLQSSWTKAAGPPEPTKTAVVRADLSPCVDNCLDAFRDSILHYDKDFDNICAVLASENDEAVLDSLYICDEGCGSVVNGSEAGQDQNVNRVISRCQSLGYSDIIDPGPPPTTVSIITSFSSTLDGSVSSMDSPCPQATGSKELGNGQQSTTSPALSTSTLAGQTNSLVLAPSTTILTASTIIPASLSIKNSITSSSMFPSTKTTFKTSMIPTVSTVVYINSKVPEIQQLSTSIDLTSSSLSPSASFSSVSNHNSPTTSTKNSAPSPTSSTAINSGIGTETRLGLFLAIIGIVLFLVATVIVLIVRSKRNSYFRTIIRRSLKSNRSSSEFKQKLRSTTSPTDDSESERCEADCFSTPPTRPPPLLSFPYQSSPRYSRDTVGRSFSGPRGRSNSRSRGNRRNRRWAYTPQRFRPSVPNDEQEEVEDLITSPVITTANGVRHQQHYLPPNLNLPIDEAGIRWPETVTLRGDSQEFLGWSQEYERKATERRARNYDLEEGRLNEDEYIGRHMGLRNGYGRSETVHETRTGTGKPLPVDPGMINAAVKQGDGDVLRSLELHAKTTRERIRMDWRCGWV